METSGLLAIVMMIGVMFFTLWLFFDVAGFQAGSGSAH